MFFCLHLASSDCDTNFKFIYILLVCMLNSLSTCIIYLIKICLCLCVCVYVQMLSCGIPELSDLEDLKYVYDALRPHESEADATMYFTRLENNFSLQAA